MGADSRPVCHRCAQIKQACDGNLPCARCIRLSLPCRPRDSSLAAAMPGLAGPDDEDVPKARIRRVQTGCLMCKRRKKKCDETKPRCGDCRRLCLDCTWPAERHKDKMLSSRGGNSPSIKVNGLRDAPILSSVHDLDPSDSESSPDSKNFVTDSNGFITDTIIRDIPFRASPSPAPSLSPRNRSLNGSSYNGSLHGGFSGNATNIANGGVPLSYSSNSSPISPHTTHAAEHPHYPNEQHIRMHAYPFGQPSTSPVSLMPATAPAPTPAAAATMPAANEYDVDMNGTRVAWNIAHPTRGSWLDAVSPVTPVTSTSSHTSRSESFDSVSTSLSIYVPQLLPQLSTPQDKALLNHYSTIVSSVLSRRPNTNNPYNSYLLPMAQGNDVVLHCILALSANHWRKLQPSMGERGMVHQSQATQALARLLPQMDKSNADVALVASLLLCMTELFDGTSEGWKLHLKGAKRLLAALRNQRGDMLTGHYKFLLRLAKFLDSAATTSTCRPPLIGDEEADAETLDRLSASRDDEDSAVYGIPKELFHLVDVVNSLADLRKIRVDRASEVKFREEAAKVEDRINNWSYECGGLSRAVWNTPGANEDVLHATTAFEHAIRLRLHQIVEGYELDNPKVSQYVDGILESVQQIRYGSPLEVCVLFPLVMAGGACSKMEHRLIIQDRLMIMERTCGFGYIYNARDLVERVWSRRDQTEGTGAIVNWARIRYEEMNGLVVF